MILSSPNPNKWSGYIGRVTDLIEQKITDKDSENTEVYLCGGRKIIEDCNFENLKNQENIKGFLEASKDTDQNFFYLGPKNNWENILNSNIREKIEDIFKDEMKELNYL